MFLVHARFDVVLRRSHALTPNFGLFRFILGKILGAIHKVKYRGGD